MNTHDIKRLSKWVKLTPLFEQAGLNPSTMRSALLNDRELTAHEQAVIQRELRRIAQSIEGLINDY